MNLFKLLLAGAAIGVIVVAFRDSENDAWLSPAGAGGGRAGDAETDATEPVLGYDGMDTDTLLDWLGEADLDQATLLRIHDYEERNRRREPVLAAISDLL